MLINNRVRIILIQALFFVLTGDVVLKSRSLLSICQYKSLMINFRIHVLISIDERLCKDCEDAARKPSFVRGHFRMVNGKKVYVKSHYRNK